MERVKIPTGGWEIAAGICLLVTLLLTSIRMVSMDGEFFSRQYHKNGTDQYTGMSFADLDRVTENLLDYIKGDRENLDMTAVIDGEEREVFDQREKDHMVDVRRLFVLLDRSIWAFGGATVLLAGLCVFRRGRSGIDRLARGFLVALPVFCVLILVLGIVFIFNFNWFWVKFHQVVFTNDLWLLDPAVSVMIRMFPLEFFYACCMRIVIGFALGTAVLAGGAAVLCRIGHLHRRQPALTR